MACPSEYPPAISSSRALSNVAGHAGVAEIPVVLGQVLAQDHPLVGDRPGRDGRDVIVAGIGDVWGSLLDIVVRSLANHEELALECVGIAYVRSPPDEDLADARLLRFHALTQAARI